MPPVMEDNTPTTKRKEKSPAFQFYPKDFLTDAKVICMSNEVLGMYIKLLCIDWLEDGIYPECILKLAGFDWLTPDGELRDDSKEIQAQLEDCFVHHPNFAERITNARLLKERQGQKERSEERAKAGKKGGLRRGINHLTKQAQLANSYSKRQAKRSPSSSTSSTSSTPISNNPSLSVTTLSTPVLVKYGDQFLSMTEEQYRKCCEVYGSPLVHQEIPEADTWIAHDEGKNARKYREPGYNHYKFFRTTWLHGKRLRNGFDGKTLSDRKHEQKLAYIEKLERGEV